jgi:SWI/SNF-related matrix-associated actin-dependent regulator 1 of chromatin subfamily A
MNTLFDFQDVGARWLAGKRFAYLADEMGLGKTPQAISAADLAGARSVSVICPASVRANWEREIERWSLGLWDYDVRSYDAAVRHGLPRADTYIIDEAHYLKTPGTARTKTLLGPGSRLRDAARIWALSGTPAPNHVGELWTWLRLFGATDLPHRKFLEAHVNFRDTPYGPKVYGNKRGAAERLATDLNPLLLRRRKVDVLKDLPAIRWGDISLAQNVAGRLSPVDIGLTTGDDLPAEDEHIARIRKLTGELKAAPLAAFLAEELQQTGEKIVVFAWHRAVMDALEQGLAKFGVARIDGSTPAARRQGIVDRFQTDAECRVFLGNIQAAGAGITLTAASNLIFAEMSWTPGDNSQAAMRVHRIGQDKPVLIRTSTLLGSIDEAVNAVLARKTRALMELFGATK